MADQPNKRNNRTGLRHPSSESYRTDSVAPLANSSQRKGRRISPDSNQAHSVSLSPDKRIRRKPPSSLYRIFGPASNEQRGPPRKFEAICPSKEPIAEANGSDDDILDDAYDSYDELFTRHLAEEKSLPQDMRKNETRWREKLPKGCTGGARELTNTRQRFLLPVVSGYTNSNSSSMIHLAYKQPWAQQYPPENLDELAVHRRKVSDVQSWFSDVFAGNREHRLLVLRGPAGSGKTTTVNLLSQSLGFDILEWKNPAISDFATKEYVSVATQFEEFLGRGNSFRKLELDGVAGFPPDGQDSSPYSQRIILIEEFPTIMNRGSSSLAAFQLSLQRYLAMGATLSSNRLGRGGTSAQASFPIVVIVSETHLHSGFSSESLTVHRLLGPELFNHPSTTIIEFNSIAPTFMYKALKLTLEKEARNSQRDSNPSPAILQNISKSGDIRSAVASLEFLCLDGGEWGIPTTSKLNQSRNNITLTIGEKETLKLIPRRQAALGIFHAVGKILYNKRAEAGIATEDPKLSSPPDHMRYHDRPGVPQVLVNELAEETGTDTQTFISALHENYIPSCDGSSFVDCVDECIRALSDSDTLCVYHKGVYGGRANGTSAGVDMMRQEDISYQVAARGLLFALPYPVKRRIALSSRAGRQGDAHKMFFPSTLRLTQEEEEIDGLANIWVKKLLNSAGGMSPGLDLDMPVLLRKCKPSQLDDCSHDHAGTVTMISREDLILHQLPYLARIHQDDVEISQLRRITGFHATECTRYCLGSEVHDSGGNHLAFASAEHSNPQIPQLKDPRYHNTSPIFGPRLSSCEEEEELLLSDDDIVDDF
ncbi:Rad17 cell cycle checkpoint protein-domain-containing protein [Aspergillus coremiiformis]|uniref:Rad17 cell cycle checkpoint protein-domain-containing protein n=1 Tax=Aspergillus coremiiformis TaxID=138285 RepID=A0A5N6YS86_9EURO|nr:Rad17 cell cycle checkpoint protein-domain-containing protein [Aspergillus coremiiformis]